MGGDWQLETATGTIEQAALVNTNYQQTLLTSKTLFAANDGVHGGEPRDTDSSTAGTFLLKDIIARANGSDPHGAGYDFTSLGNGKTMFRATNASDSGEIWITDGTTSDTKLLRNINPLLDSGPGDDYFTAFGNGRLIFSAVDSVHGGILDH